MTQHKFRVWTGPTAVDGYAELIEESGLTVTCRGTEHVHIAVDADSMHLAREIMFNKLHAPLGGSRAASMAFGSERIGYRTGA